ncbi:CRISPR-associated helicase cas3 domain protein [Lactobacillus intestinalis DSM 6629]|uniref:CRISPR-associated helicase cas3 domain protein n=2 Tax=Lactobacillus intestinalis TaxID=151781 RepID=A0ABR5PS21_9LACO|nr:CRISPR-associated helicase cas3 domain protein [Lactobacillus intestinalis DSM 6629]
MLKQPNIHGKDDWRLLEIACAYHDLGKMNLRFQKKVKAEKSYCEDEIPHALLSITMLPIEELKKQYTKEELIALIFAIKWHHERDLGNIDKEYYEREIETLRKEFDGFDYSKLNFPIHPQEPTKIRVQYLKNHLGHRLSYANEPNIFDEFVMLKGLLNRIDYAASGHYEIESKSRVYLSQNILQHWRKDNPTTNWNDLQDWTYKNRNESIIVVGQTGLGKTESALRWLDNSKSFFVLPLKSAIDSIYDRISKIVFQNNSHENLALLHSDMMSKALSEKFNKEESFDEFVNEERSWSKQLSIATLDQIFSFVYHYKNYEPKLATLAYSKIVIDEIQMYSPDLLGYLIFGLKEVQKYGGKFEIMTATLPPFLVDLLKSHGLRFKQAPQPFLDSKVDHRHKVKVLHKQINSDDIIKMTCHQKTLVVCNTVKSATKLYSELKQKGILNIHLIHSRFIRKDRSKKEKEILEFGQKENQKAGIWIGTQVVEASLDIDFDLLITELSEMCGLFQRMGRCYRKRNYEGKEPNVYVFDGGDKPTSGIHKSTHEYKREERHSVVDYHLFNLSKKAIAKLDGYLTESNKLKLINENYATDKLLDIENCKLIEKVNDCIKYLDDLAFLNTPISKEKAINDFRDINTVDVIPEKVFLEYKDEIESAAQTLNTHLKKEDFPDQVTYKKQCQILVQEKIKAREIINNYLVSIPFYVNNKVSKHRWMENDLINKFGYRILPADFDYDSETGLSYRDGANLNNEIDYDDNMF